VLSRAWTSRCETTIWSISSRSCPGFGGRVAVPLVRPRLMPSGHSSVQTRSTAGRATWLGSRWPSRTMAPAIAGPSLSIEYTLVTLDGVFEDPQIRAPGDALASRARQPGHHRRPGCPAPLGQRDRLLEAGRIDQPAGWRRRPHRAWPGPGPAGRDRRCGRDAGNEACPCGPGGAVGARHPPGRLVDEDVLRHGAVPPCLGCLGQPGQPAARQWHGRPVPVHHPRHGRPHRVSDRGPPKGGCWRSLSRPWRPTTTVLRAECSSCQELRFLAISGKWRSEGSGGCVVPGGAEGI
jgi:hypothetical protein